MYEEKVILVNEVGLHARPASVFIQEAVKYDSEIFVEKNGKVYNAKSIMSILSMGAFKGEEITIRANGEDAKEAVESLVNLIKTRLSDY